MTKPTKNRRPLVNVSELARQMGISVSYARLLYFGERKAPKRVQQMKEILSKLTKAA
jgi:hypothetical protein